MEFPVFFYAFLKKWQNNNKDKDSDIRKKKAVKKVAVELII